MQPCKIALVDDHVLIRNGLAGLINTFDGYTVLFQANNGEELIRRLSPEALPDIILLDINMPRKDGFETACWLKEHYPEIKILALSMYDNESAIIRMIRNGAGGYILKDAEPAELRTALNSLQQKGFYYSELVTGHLVHTISKLGDDAKIPGSFQLNEREIEFLKFACSELNYKEIADKMFLSPRTIDGYRDALFEKLNVRSRVGLVLYAIKNRIVSIDQNI